MKSEEFRKLFLEEVVDPLLDLGFQFPRRSKSLTMQRGPLVFSLIRLDGKFSRPQGIAHIGAFRHTFLRDCEAKSVRYWTGVVFDHPFKVRPADLAEFGKEAWSYTPMNLSFEPQFFDYDQPEEVVRPCLQKLRSTLETHVPRVMSLLDPARCLDEIRRGGQEAVCEKYWQEDYARYLSEPLPRVL